MNTLPHFENINELNEYLTPFPDSDKLFVENQSWLKEHFLPLISIDLGMLNDDWRGQVVHMVNPYESIFNNIGHFTQNYHNDFIGENYIAFRLTDDNCYEFLGDERYFVFHPTHKDELKDLLTFDWEFEQISNNPEVIERTKIGHLDECLEQIQEAKNFYHQNKQQFEEVGYIHDESYENEYGGRYLDRMGGEIDEGNWTFLVDIPPAYQLEVDDENYTVKISYKGNPFYHIASVSAYTYADGADAVILMYEPISRIVLFTFDNT